MANKIQKKEILGGRANKAVSVSPVDGSKIVVDLEPSPDYSPEKVKKDLLKYGLKPIENVEVINPITGQKSLVTIDRTGTHEDKLAVIAARYTQGEITRDQLDATLSLYLFERGKENTSMLVDLFRYKGAHTKETRVFTSQMRFDFEMFISLFCEQMRAIARDIAEEYNIKNIKEFCDGYVKELDEARKNNQVPETSKWLDPFVSKADRTNVRLMIRNWTEAERLEGKQEALKVSRMREKGFGIYIDAQGKPYDIFKDEEIVDIVKRDKDRLAELKKEENE